MHTSTKRWKTRTWMISAATATLFAGFGCGGNPDCDLLSADCSVCTSVEGKKSCEQIVALESNEQCLQYTDGTGQLGSYKRDCECRAEDLPCTADADCCSADNLSCINSTCSRYSP
jgi:hypothetical protein